MRHPDTGEVFVNCDPQLIQLIRETECMMKMKLPIPETARILYFRRTTIKRVVDDLKVGSGISLADAASMPRVRWGGGTPIWKGLGCSWENLNYIWAWLKLCLTPETYHLKWNKPDY